MATMPDGSQERRRANQFILSGTNRWKGYSCDAGLESLRVKGSGEVLRAVCGVGGVIGRLGEDVTLPVAPIRCTRERCTCITDILITKRREAGAEAPAGHARPAELAPGT